MRYFDIKPMGDGITLLTEVGVRPWLRCNIWHVAGRDRDLVIDTGMGLSPLKTELMTLTERPLTAIATHTHFDHSGGMCEFDTRLGHRAEAATLAAPDPDNTLSGGPWTAAELIDPEVYPDFDIRTYCVRPAPLTGYLDEGDVIDLGNRAFQILHLPGHSPGSIGLWDVKARMLFSGDAIYDGGLLDNLYHSEPEVLRQTLTRIRGLGVEIVHGGHSESFGQARLEALVDEYLAGGLRIDDFDGWMREQLAEHIAGCAQGSPAGPSAGSQTGR